ncbi:hypothetical protein Lal_00017842 [Lupinus albus]|uniref:Uncharacterized protein n=1 Tax=Lupinus albus TaxID=3870 RepID=A0A6A4ND03_LUPAL|nr:hypothetical protein Lalb_Chr25g0287851 [Lupinus albus]KAF1866459.1 hypothetical protein Lal_00017842 [Lupinus albus]
MDKSVIFGFMAVFAVSGSMVLLANQVHKHILSNFMKKFEFEIGGVVCKHGKQKLGGCKKHHANKKVRFEKEVFELPLEKKGYNKKVTRAQKVKDDKVLIMKKNQKWESGSKLEDIMPLNRVVLYREIMKYRTIKGRLLHA